MSKLLQGQVNVISLGVIYILQDYFSYSMLPQ